MLRSGTVALRPAPCPPRLRDPPSVAADSRRCWRKYPVAGQIGILSVLRLPTSLRAVISIKRLEARFSSRA